MKIECVQDKLRTILSQSEKIAGKNLTLPVLSCVLLTVEKGHLTVRSTNLDMGFESSVPVKVEEEGVCAVPASVLTSFINNISNEKSIKLTSDGNIFSLTTQKNKTTIKCLPYEDFPTIPELTNTQTFEIEAGDFVKGLKAVWYSSSVSSIKPELASVYMYPEENNVLFVATDSFRLAEKRVKTKEVKDFDRVLIPFKNITEIIRVLEQAQGTVKVSLNKNQIAFNYGSTRLVSRVIDGTFPDYRQIIPKEFKTEVVVLKEDLLRSLKIANIFSDTFNQVSVVISPEEKKFELTTKNSNLGENTTALSGALSGEPAESSFNYKYINDCLQSIDADSVSLSFAGQGRPVVVRGVSDKSFTYLVMPMNR
ncbi:MAG: DNA polymerase III subunit beta [Candidatus Taylorbacteria bacterium]|nr:DNA polymerase III subunit beta [Candidatus Taylorbacteria bacterium]